MLDVMWHLVTPYELHPEWPSAPPIDKEKRAFAARFFFLPLYWPIGTRAHAGPAGRDVSTIQR